MGFFSGVRGRKLKIAWTYGSEREIWHLLPTARRVLICEERDVRARIVTFSGIDRKSGRVLWGGRSFVDPWWTGLEGVDDGVFYLHGYAVPDMPWHKGITAVNILEGTRRWEQPGLVFEGLSERGLIASSGMPGSRTFCLLDTATGSVLEEWNETDGGERVHLRGAIEGSTFPFVAYEDSQAVPLPVKEHLRLRQALWPVELAEDAGCFVCSFSVRTGPSENPSASQHIVAYRADDFAEVYHQVIARDVGGFSHDSFCIQDGMLCFVMERSTVHGVRLSDD
jgi:hypothetical protein